MATIELKGLTFAYEGSYHNVFEDLDLQLDTGWRLGLIGPNGRGKSTLMKLIGGELDGGRAVRTPVLCRRFPMEADEGAMTLEALSALAPGAEEWEILRETGRLGLEAEALYRPFSTLSGGERTRALLAALFLDEGTYPLIDEPTNHLDREGRAQVADYLARQRGFLLVSHDRAFLDGCVDHILALERTGPRLQAGNWSAWERDWEARNAWEERREAQLRRETAQLRRSARQAGQWADQVEKSKQGGVLSSGLKPDRGHVGHMAAKMAKRAKNIEKRRLEAVEEKEGLLQNLEREAPLKLTPLVFQGPRLLTLKGVAPVLGGRPVCAPVDLDLRPGERVAVTGPNGRGKTSLLRLLAGEQVEYQGELLRPGRLEVSYLPQDTRGLRGSLGQAIEAWGLDPTQCRTILRKLGFERRELEGELSQLSQGQKKKVLLARSLCRQAHLYIWDEPLNYLDIWSRRQLEEMLLAAGASLIFVEHDLAFRQRIATRTVELEAACGEG